MREGVGELYDSTFTPAAVRPLLAALRRAYQTACELHDPERGSNEMTFGLNLYHFATHELRREVRAAENAMRDTSAGQVFRLGLREFELACYRVGRSGREDIMQSLPNNDGAASAMVDPQLCLFGIEEEYDLPRARKVVIAHLGNAEDGLAAVYLCIAGRTDGDRITSWAHAERIWHADDENEAAVSVAPAPYKPADEVIPSPTVRKKPQEERKTPPKEDSEEET